MTNIIAHRGSKGTHPENTLSAFKEAIASGSDGIELDVHLTMDKELVVIHDEWVDRTTDGFGEVESFTLEEIQTLDAGSWFAEGFKGEKIPTLESVLELLQKEKYEGLLNIEIKTDIKKYRGIEQKVVELMQKQQWTFQFMYSSFSFDTLITLHELDPETEIAYIFHEEEIKVDVSKSVPFVKAIHPNIQWVLKKENQISEYELPIRPWTVNREEEMRACFEMNIKEFHTDYPREAMKLKAFYEGKK